MMDQFGTWYGKGCVLGGAAVGCDSDRGPGLRPRIRPQSLCHDHILALSSALATFPIHNCAPHETHGLVGGVGRLVGDQEEEDS